jgi:hypothetical protein
MNVASYVLDRWPALCHDQASIFFNWKENNIWALLACFFKKKLMTWIIDPIESNKMLRFNYMMKENDNKWTKFKKKRWLCWLVKRKKNYEAQFQDNQMLNDEIEEKWQKKTSTIKPSYHGKLTSHNSGCEVELTS